MHEALFHAVGAAADPTFIVGGSRDQLQIVWVNRSFADAVCAEAADLAETQALMRAAIPAAHIDFIRGFENAITLGDYLFVHAGILPDVPLDQQRVGDLRWIRQPFLDHPGSHGPVVIHGHTIFKQPDIRHNRIGIDTGAYETGVLTALGLEGQNRWLIEARMRDGAMRVTQRSIS